MRRSTFLECTIIVAFLLAGISNGAFAADKNVKLGDRISNLTFKDIHYLPRSLDDFPKAKAFVLVFTDTTCPIVQR